MPRRRQPDATRPRLLRRGRRSSGLRGAAWAGCLGNPGAGYQTDVDDDPYALLVELDGRLGHEEKGRFRDTDRENVHVVLGRATLRHGHPDVLTRPCAVAWQVAEVLLRCGWGGLPRRCPRCVRLAARAS